MAASCADHDRPLHRDTFHYLAHGFGCNLISELAIALFPCHSRCLTLSLTEYFPLRARTSGRESSYRR